MSTSQTAVFREVVRAHMRPPPVAVGPDTPIAEAVRAMAGERVSAAVVVDAERRILGILTEQDVVRRVACQRTGDEPVRNVMTRPVLRVADDDYLYQAIGFMRRNRLRHMPVVDADGALVGVLFLHDATAVAAASRVHDIDRLTHETSVDGLKESRSAQVQLAADLLEDGVPAPEVQQVISDLNNDVHRRIVELSVRDLAVEGWGEPPRPFATLVTGSGGRGESMLAPDQDVGMIIGDYPDAEHAQIDRYFVALAERVTDRLAFVGFPRCRGGVMAINPVWRKTLPQWRAQVHRWLARRHPVMLQLFVLLYDFSIVQGEAAFGRDLRACVTEEMRTHRQLAPDFYDVQAEHGTVLGVFRRLRTERRGEQRGKLNLKHGGTLPLVEAVRLMAMRHGVEATGTLARIAALAGAGLLSRDEVDHLSSAYAFITGLQLRTQIEDVEAGREVSNHVHPEGLTERERNVLRDSLVAINAFRDRVRADMGGGLL